MSKIKIMSIFGTRPEAIKMAPLVKALERHHDFESICCVTAQHREMLDSVLEIFDVQPNFDLNIMQHGQTLASVTSKCLMGIDTVLASVRPDMVLVHGDPTTSFSAALSAFYHKIPVGHVEAGLRTGDINSPFPEELNRVLTAKMATLHFCPTELNRQNLIAEGVKDGIYVTGNTVIDAMATTVRKEYVFSDEKLRKICEDERKIVLVTCHRRENYGQAMDNITDALAQLAEQHKDVLFVWPVHPAPTVKQAAERLEGIDNISLISPINAEEMHNLIARSYMVMTDSGGLQEEAPALGKPVLVLRRETERPEAVQAGTVKVAGVDKQEICRLANLLLDDEDYYKQMANAVNPYGDGMACARILEAVRYHFKLTDTPPERF